MNLDDWLAPYPSAQSAWNGRCWFIAAAYERAYCAAASADAQKQATKAGGKKLNPLPFNFFR